MQSAFGCTDAVSRAKAACDSAGAWLTNKPLAPLPVCQPLDEVRVPAGEQQHRQRVDGHLAVEAKRRRGVRLQWLDGLVAAAHDDLVQHDLRAAMYARLPCCAVQEKNTSGRDLPYDRL
jgi:hypothetical protein